MTRQRLGLVLAIVLAVVGSVLAIRAMRGSRAKVAKAVPVQASDAVRATLSHEVLDVVPTPATVDDIEQEVRRRVLEEIRAVPTMADLTTAQQEDLAQAFIERWRALIDPDMERDHATMAARGDPRTEAQAAAKHEQARAWSESLKMSPIGLNGIVVRDHADASSPAIDGGFDGFEGFERVVTNRNTGDKMPVPESPVEEGWRSVHIVMPFEKQVVMGEGLGVALVGFEFVWSGRRGQWVPSCAIMYIAPGEAHGAVPF